MSVQYDPKVIVQFAEALYARAARIILFSVVWFAFLGAIIGAIAGASRGASGGLAVFLAIVGGAFGLSYGRAKAFSLRLEAQSALCQVQIEQNTKKADGI